ncbi:MAG: biopolymer transporter ExbD [Bdellovibrio sp.]|nr:biopolymer transporter ExbD [Bdellovibrio sp.]
MRAKFLKRGFTSEEMSLQITSMADVFIILLVFLLKSYASGIVQIQPSSGTHLPKAYALDASTEALKIEVSENSIQLEGAPVLPLKNFVFGPNDVLQNGVSQKLSAVFEKERKKQVYIAENNKDVSVDSKIILVADEKAPYQTIKTVLASAAIHGYTDFKLAVVKGD